MLRAGTRWDLGGPCQGWDPTGAGHSAPWVLTAGELVGQELGGLLA